MKNIYKYPVHEDITNIPLRLDRILDIQYQGLVPVLWAIVDSEKPEVQLQINVLGTGWDFSGNPGEHVSTCQDAFGYVWHFFAQVLDNDCSDD